MIVGVLTIALAVAVATTGLGSVDNLTSRGIAAGHADYFALGGGLMLAMLMGLSTLVGFEAAANLAEEPRIRIALVVIGLLLVGGLYFLAILMFDRKSLSDRARRDACYRGPELRICHDRIIQSVPAAISAYCTVTHCEP